MSAIRRQMGFDKTATKPKNKPASISPSMTEEVEELPEDIFTQPINLKNSKILILKLHLKVLIMFN